MRKLYDQQHEVYININDIIAIIYKSKCQIMESKEFTPEQKGFGNKSINLILDVLNKAIQKEQQNV